MRTEVQKQRQREANRRYDAAHPERRKAHRKAWRERNKEHIRAYDRDYFKTNPGKKEAVNAKWRAANPEKVKKTRAAACVRGRKELADHYIRKTLSNGTGLPTTVWPQALVDLQRARLQLKRETKKGQIQ